MNFKLNYLKPLFISICAGMLFFSCEYAYIEPVQISDDPVSYAEKIQPAFNSHCNSCHTNTNPKLTDGVSYDNLMNGGFIDIDNPAQSQVYLNTVSGHPASFLPEESAYLLLWIEQGALDN